MTPQRPRVLFVLENEQAVEAIKIQLRRSKLEADVTFAQSAFDAIAHIEERPIDHVFTDVRLAGTDGVELLRRVSEKDPSISRIIIADAREIGSLESSGVAHKYLTRPWNMEEINEAIRRSYEMEDWLSDPGLKHALERTERLPTAPSAYTEIAEEMRASDPSMARISKIIARDPALTAKVLKHVNSAYFALRHEITTIDRAVNLIGMNGVSAIVMAVGLYGGTSHVPGPLVESIKQRSLAVAAMTRAIAKMESVSGIERENAFLAAMLHDCGKLVMSMNWPDEFNDIAHQDDLDKEQQLIGANHALIGAYLLSTWNVAGGVVEAVAHHHRPSAGNFEQFGAAGLVHIAHTLISRPGNGSLPGLDLEFVGQFELWDHTADWIAATEELEASVFV